VDLFGNTPATAAEATFAWTDGVAADTAAPEVLAVTVADGRLRLTLSEEADLASAAPAIQIAAVTENWTLDADGYTLVSATVLDPGAHTVAAGTGLLDLVGTPLAEPFSHTFSLAPGQTEEMVYLAPATDVIAASTVGNHRGFHGLEEDPATGLIYARNRWFDPELGRFASVDPMGYSDGPNLYQYGLNNPINFSDPLGLRAAKDKDFDKLRQLIRLEAELKREYKATGTFRGQEITPAQYEHALVDVRSRRSSYIQAVEEAYEGEEIGRVTKPVSFFDNRQVVVYRRIPSYERWVKETTQNARILAWTVEGPNLAASLLAVGTAPRVMRRPSNAAQQLGEASRSSQLPVLNSDYAPGARYSGRYEDGQRSYRTNVPRDPNTNIPTPDPDALGPHSRLQPDARDPSRVYSATEFNAAGDPVRRVDFAGRAGDSLPHEHPYDPETKGFGPKRPLD